MPSPSWSKTQLGKVLTVKHGYAFKGQYFGKGGVVRLVTPGNFFEGGGFRDRGDEQKSYDGPIPPGYQLEAGSLVVAMTEQSPGLLGSAGLVPDDGFTWLHNQRIGLVVVDPTSADKNFIRCLLNSPPVREQLAATGTGTKVRHTAPGRIEDVRVELPPLAVQCRIGALLSAFDETIEINEQRIDELEGLVRSFGRGWLLDHRGVMRVLCSDAVRDSGITLNGQVSDLADLCVDGVDPAEFDPADRYVGLEHLPRRRTTLSTWGSTESLKSRKLRFRPGDTLFGKIRPNLHKVASAPFSGVASSDAMVFRSKAGKPAAGFLSAILSSDQVVAEATVTANGTKMPRADAKVLMCYRLPIPNDAALRKIDDTVSGWLRFAAQLAAQIDGLRRAHNLLLPRLVAGQLDLADIELGALTPPESE